MSFLKLNRQALLKSYKAISAIWISTVIALSFISANQTKAANAQNDPQIANKIKSAYLYNFLKFVEFGPDKAEKERFDVCILGVDPFGEALAKIATRKAKGKPVSIRKMLDVSETKTCDIIYISESKKLELIPVLKELNTRSVLTVSDIENFTQVGGIVRFFPHNGKIGIEINLTRAKQSEIQISALLLEIARIIEWNC